MERPYQHWEVSGVLRGRPARPRRARTLAFLLSAIRSVAHYGCQLAATIPCCEGSFAALTIDPAPRPLDVAEYIAIA
jgi:hypothetical protein